MEILTGLIDRCIKTNNNTLPTLQSFRMSYNPADTIEGFSSPHALPLWRTGGISPLIRTNETTTSVFSSLKHLTVDNVTHDWSLLTLSGLHTLRILNIPSHNSPSYTDLHRLLLDNAETLTTLELSNISVSDLETVGGRFTLPNVQKMTIGFAHPRDLVWAAQTLDLPALDHLILEDQAAGTGEWMSEVNKRQTVEGYQELTRCFPLSRVRRLVLRYVVFYKLPQPVEHIHGESEQTFAVRFLSNFKEVKALEVSAPDFSLSEVLETFSYVLFPNLRSYYLERA
ncbi:hypothetical protein AAF712_008541 [Marasmius tenuissimus]|uniref:Uncharacterized protein n=1 Tax=Marasmius tenuissimus TaxID=585030 RepID=A0ABR2ZTT0_9AGAR